MMAFLEGALAGLALAVATWGLAAGWARWRRGPRA